MNKKGQSTGWTFIFTLVTLFGIGVIFIVFSEVFSAYLVPTIKNQVNSTEANIPYATQVEVNSNIDKYMQFFNILPFILFGAAVVYLFISVLRKEGDSVY